MKLDLRPASRTATGSHAPPTRPRRVRLAGWDVPTVALLLVLWLVVIAVLGVAVHAWFWMLLFPTILTLAMTVGIRRGSELIQGHARRMYSLDERDR